MWAARGTMALAALCACTRAPQAMSTGGVGAGAVSGSVAMTGGIGGVGATSGIHGGGMGGGVGGVGGTGGTGGNAGATDDAGLDASAFDASALDAGEMPMQDLPQALRDAGVIALFPAPGSRDQCNDPSLRITFSGPPTLGDSGRVDLYADVLGADVMASINLATQTTSHAINGTDFTHQRAAYVDGNSIVLYLRPAVLGRGATYAVNVLPGAITGPTGVPVEIDDRTTWTFTVADAPSDLSDLRVALDGKGDFCSPQGAIDATGAGNATVTIGRGKYFGIVYFRDKSQLTLRGEDRDATILLGTNSENLNPGTAKRALVGIDDVSDLTIENLTIHNLTPQGGSQAEALRMQDCERCSVRDANILSLQDTLLWSGTVFARSCYIEGNVDFIWGTGAAYFIDSEIKTVGRSGYNVQARNGADGYGYVFVDSKLTSDPGVSGHWLARVDSSVYPSSHVAYIDCELGTHIDPRGFQVTGGGTSTVRFWEYQSHSPEGALVDVSQRGGGARQLSSGEAAQMRDPSVVLGGWDPE